MTDLVLFENENFIIDMMYARADNMMSCAVYQNVGYGNCAYMHKDVAQALLNLIPELQKKSYKMRICDAYRPPIAHQKCVEAVPIEGFFKADYRLSNHCYGTAVDVCLTDLQGNNLIYPTEVDAYRIDFAEQVKNGKFEEFKKYLVQARHDYNEASAEAIKNREFLKELMENNGFESIPHEWWHYNLKGWKNYSLIEWDR